jgi:hypothetical protein
LPAVALVEPPLEPVEKAVDVVIVAPEIDDLGGPDALAVDRHGASLRGIHGNAVAENSDAGGGAGRDAIVVHQVDVPAQIVEDALGNSQNVFAGVFGEAYLGRRRGGESEHRHGAGLASTMVGAPSILGRRRRVCHTDRADYGSVRLTPISFAAIGVVVPFITTSWASCFT